MWWVFAALQMEYERALCISLERTRPHKYFLGNNGFYWNPETGEISLDPGKNVPQSMQLPPFAVYAQVQCREPKTGQLKVQLYYEDD